MNVRRVVVIAFTCVALLAGESGAGASRPTVERSAAVPQRPLRILVTNDDGVGAPGIDAVVEKLRTLPNVQVTVVAPLTNQSGSGDKFSTTPLTASAATTQHGYPATAVNGFPADSVFLAFKSLLKALPDIVVSGVNQGQNIGELVDISGTVGAARTAARLGVPSIAVSAGLASNIDYSYAAKLTTFLVELWRNDLIAHPLARPRVLNVNVPTCPTVRGIEFVPVGRSRTVTSYTQSSTGTYTAVVQTRDLLNANCTSTLQHPTDDIAAFTNGFAAISRLAVNS
jgi:5'-nucleotidase